ncbi:MAG: hypothetical protein JO199_13495, partial [Candidatus Eremiobacteraeota bacterium]|nr:hypothetical protein [Candidatus Eremiobacteraeota bacterium]
MVLLRAFVVGIIGVAALSLAAMSIASMHEEYGIFGYTVAYDGLTISSVTPHYPAANAGLRPGDRLEFAPMSLRARSNSVLNRQVASGTKIVFVADRSGSKRRFLMTARPLAPNAGPWMVLFGTLTSLAILGIGIALVLLKPNRMTWGFLLWGAGFFAGSDWLNGLSQQSPTAYAAITLFATIVGSIGAAGLLAFVSSFPNPTPHPALRFLSSAAIPYAATIAVLTLAQRFIAAFGTDAPPAWLNIFVTFVVPLVDVVVASAALLATTLSDRRNAHRVAPVLLCVVLTTIVSVAMTLQEAHFIDATALNLLWLAGVLTTFGTAVAVAYAIVRHRVIEITFAIGRTLAMTTFSASAVGALMVLHWLAVNTIAEGSLRFFFEIGGAVGIAVAIPRINASIATLLDRTVFVRRFVAERRLRQVAAAIEYSDDPATIASLLVRQPVEALGLASAAFFHRTDPAADFVAAAKEGWSNEHAAGLAHNDLLILSLRAAGCPLNVADAGASRTDFPAGPLAPAIAFPVVARKQLLGVALYGLPSDGSAMDDDRFRMLRRIVRAASIAFARAIQAQKANEAVRELQEVNGASARFIPDEFLRMLGKENISRIELGDHVEREMTVLFADIRNFTALSEELTPGESFEFLNAYLNRVGPIVREHGGFIDKYIGDSVMALFPAESDAALDAALAVQREVRAFSKTLRAQGKPGIAVGIGLHTGRLMLGTIGERARMETTVISDAVNLASRMEGATKTFGASIVLSEATFARLSRPQNYLVRPLGKIVVRGKRQPVEIYEAYGGDAPEIAVRKEASIAEFAHAVARYENGDWHDAEAAFAEIHRLNVSDEAALYFRNRCTALIESAGIAGWD